MKTIRLNFSELIQDTDTPVIHYCRHLIEQGEKPDTKLEIYRERETPDIIVHSIGDAAKLRVSDNKFKLDTRYIKNTAEKAGRSLPH